MSTLLSKAPTTADADILVKQGLATAGDLIVSGGSGKVFRVDRLLKGGVNYAATCEDGKQWKVRVAHAKSAPVGTVFAGPELPEDNDDTIIGIHPGTVVRFKRGKWAAEGKMVVLRDNGDTVSVTKLGGTWGTRYIRGVSYTQLEIVAVD